MTFYFFENTIGDQSVDDNNIGDNFIFLSYRALQQ